MEEMRRYEKVRFSKKFERDREFYVRMLAKGNYLADESHLKDKFKVKHLRAVKHFYYKYDSTGYDVLYDLDASGKPYCNLVLFKKIMWVKAWINLQIKMWVDGLKEGLFFLSEISEHCEKELWPEWAFKAVKQQFMKQGLTTEGFEAMKFLFINI